MNKKQNCARLFKLAVCLLLINGCSEKAPDGESIDQPVNKHKAETSDKIIKSEADNNSPIWAINLGGAEYQGINGIRYQADTLAIPNDMGNMSDVLGTQHRFLYQTYRVGDMQISRPIDNGLYDITFMFAEPDDIPTGSRVFNVLAQGQPVIEKLDIRQARDGKHISALSRTVTDVEVTSGVLNIELTAIKGQPILNAILANKKQRKSEEWSLVWSDEFNYSGAPDHTKWNLDIWPARKVNEEDQAYTHRPENVIVHDGNLVITALKESYSDAEYTSARIHSKGKGDFLYGRAEIRAKLPAGRGTWSAIWMLPSDPYKYATNCEKNEEWQGSSTCDAWPNSGEIDIMEHVGFDMQNIHGTVHNKAYYWVNWQQRKGSIEGKNVEQEFHVYAMEWTPEQITIFFDDTPYFIYSNELTGWKAWPFDHPYHIILNLAIGGMWGRAGGPIDDTIFPVQMEVDYVRVFQQTNNGQ
ncbi:hypothetical protein GCM10007978_03550 [Shewanella hanedai]|uniref:Family 16 glycosylhydrolase n=1 Tax=Shewanella hanedai TaxID=25 RepID=A0A553JU52_SHEHA|nr:family 16 glycosylhydrolase [Shewanella hanedai]TRY15975.1 family 16 glycosylhydrolase [Shewanella hanedai]GGI69073.1 hypothetical protein GCM10007978_03550 [Shewanella hanedai]